MYLEYRKGNTVIFDVTNTRTFELMNFLFCYRPWKHPWKNKFFGYQKERIIKCQQASWPEDDVKPLRPFFYTFM